MTQYEEAEKVTRNLNGDVEKIATYIVARCGDFIFDHERASFIADFLQVAAKAEAPGLPQADTE